MKRIITFIFVSVCALASTETFAEPEYLRFWLPDPHQLQPVLKTWGGDPTTDSLITCPGGTVAIWGPTMSSSPAYVPPGITYGSTLTWANRTYGPKGYPVCLAPPGAILSATPGSYTPANGMVQFIAGGTPFYFQLTGVPSFIHQGKTYYPVRCKDAQGEGYPKQIGCCFSPDRQCPGF